MTVKALVITSPFSHLKVHYDGGLYVGLAGDIPCRLLDLEVTAWNIKDTDLVIWTEG